MFHEVGVASVSVRPVQVDLLDEALGVLDEEEDQRKEKERQRAQKPWKPQHRGRFRLSLQDSSYYDHRLYSSYRHFNRSRAFHGSKHSSSTTHLSATNDPVSPSPAPLCVCVCSCVMCSVPCRWWQVLSCRRVWWS